MISIQRHNKIKIKKKKRKVDINGHNFEIEWAQVEKKTPHHGLI